MSATEHVLLGASAPSVPSVAGAPGGRIVDIKAWSAMSLYPQS